MIDPQNGLQALFDSMTHELANDVTAVANTLQAQTSDAIARGQTAPPTSTLLDAALAQEPGSVPASQPGQPAGAPFAGAAPGAGTASSAGVPLPSVVAAELAVAAGSGNTPGSDATLEALSRLIGSAVNGANPPVAAPPSATEAAVAKLFANLDSGAASAFGDAATVRALTALLGSATFALAATSPGAPLLAQLVTLVRQAIAAPTEGEMANLQSAISALLAQQPNQSEAAAALARLTAGLPTPMGATSAASKTQSGRAAKSDRSREAANAARFETGEDLEIPERDFRGRPYDAVARARLARLGRDPRSGFAPEATAAYEAEAELGLTYERAGDPSADYVDSDGAAWKVLTPREAFGLEALARALGSGANLIISLKNVSPDQVAPATAVVARLASTPDFGRVMLVEAEGS